MLRSTIRMGRQFKMLPPRTSAPLVKLSPSARNEACCRTGAETGDAKRAAADTGDTGTGKDLFAYACHQASPERANLTWR